MEDELFESLLGFLQQQRGFDFTGYKRPSLMRRVLRRMQLVGVQGFDAYTDYLEVHPDEFPQLFNAILINVTTFFRDAAAWDYLKANVIPAIVRAKKSTDAVRVWSAGCASGQEAYTIAILLAEAMGVDEFHARVKVYATDADEEALKEARLASYSAKQMEDVPAELRERYFEEVNSRHVFRGDLRRAVIFGRHDLVQDAPISRLDLLICRNTLMYFNKETQARVLSRFHFALNARDQSPGYLFLGRAEMLLTRGDLFSPLELKCRVFLKVPLAGAAPRALSASTPPAENNGPEMTQNERLSELAVHESPTARIVIDAEGALAIANQKARLLFSIGAKDLGRPIQDLEISYRPIELRGMIEQAYSERRAVTRAEVERRFNDGQIQYLDVIVQPLHDDTQKILGVAVTFLDVSRTHRLQQELQRAREEVQSANEELQASNEELETTNEELQSSNEELETTNEELQSTNEELETMNEELQSTNEELQTVNEELRQRTDALNQSNAFLESVLTSLRGAAVVVNHNLDVLVWNQRAEDLWGLRRDEVLGRSLLNLDIGLPVAQLRDVVRPCLTGDESHQEFVLDAVNRRGKNIRCRVACTPLLSATQKREGAILLMEEIH
jgi:two-component system CheB/CheR fusion protein